MKLVDLMKVDLSFHLISIKRVGKDSQMVQNLPINNTYIDTFRGTGYKNGQGRKDNPRNLSIFCFRDLTY